MLTYTHAIAYRCLEEGRATAQNAFMSFEDVPHTSDSKV